MHTMFAVLILALTLALRIIPASGAPFAYEDRNCNGVFDGDDVNLSANGTIPATPGNPPAALSVFSEHCLVIPAGSVSNKGWEFIFIEALGHVTIGGSLTTTLGIDDFGDAWIKGASLTVLSGARWTSKGPMYVGANAGLLNIGDSVAFTTKGGYVDTIAYHEAGLTIGKGFVVRALDQVDISARRGALTVKPGLNVLTGIFGPVNVFGKLGVDIDGATLKGYSVDVETPAAPLRFTNSRIRFTIPAEGFGNVSSQDFSGPCCVLGPVDVTGSQFPDGEVSITGDPIIGP